METWVRFLRTGSPEGSEGDVDSWPALSTSSDVVRIWDHDGQLQLESPEPHTRDVIALWDKYYGLQL